MLRLPVTRTHTNCRACRRQRHWQPPELQLTSGTVTVIAGARLAAYGTARWGWAQSEAPPCRDGSRGRDSVVTVVTFAKSRSRPGQGREAKLERI